MNLNRKMFLILTFQYMNYRIFLPLLLRNGRSYHRFHRWQHAAGFHSHNADAPGTIDSHAHKLYHIDQRMYHTDLPPATVNWNGDSMYRMAIDNLSNYPHFLVGWLWYSAGTVRTADPTVYRVTLPGYSYWCSPSYAVAHAYAILHDGSAITDNFIIVYFYLQLSATF